MFSKTYFLKDLVYLLLEDSSFLFLACFIFDLTEKTRNLKKWPGKQFYNMTKVVKEIDRNYA